MEISSNTTSVSDVLAALESRIENWRMERKGLSLQVDALDVSIRRAKEEHGKITNSRLPVSRLHNEILVMIFQAGRTMRSKELASHVCRHWRSVAINTPCLWTSIRIGDLRGPRKLEALASYLERSKSCPLDISYRCDEETPNEALASFHVLAAYIHRFRRFHLFTHREPVISALVAHLHTTRTPLLEHLSIDFDDDNQPSNFLILMAYSPLLSFLRLHGDSISFNQSFPNTSTVTTLHLGYYHRKSYGQFRTILTMSPHLTNLSLVNCLVDDWPSYNPPTIGIPTLRCLRIANADLAFKVLLALQAPSLEFLTLTLLDERCNDWIQSQHTSSASIKFPELKSLTLYRNILSESQCRLFCHTFPTIVHVTLPGHATTMLRSLGKSDDPSADMVWPKLSTITLQIFWGQGDPFNLLHAALLSRQELGLPVSELHVHNQDLSWTPDQLPALLCKVVNVEKEDDYERWPPNLGYLDEEDELLSISNF